MSDTYQSLSHSRWNCKYHVVFVPTPESKVPTIRRANPIETQWQG